MKEILKRAYRTLFGFIFFFKFLLINYGKIKRSDAVFFLPFYHTGGAERVHLDIIKAINSSLKVCVIFSHKSATNAFKKEFFKNADCIEINDIRNKRCPFINKILLASISKAINKSSTVKKVFGCNTIYYYELLPKLSKHIYKIDLFHAFTDNDDREIYIVESVKYIDKRVVINRKAEQDLYKIYEKYNVPVFFRNSVQIIENGIKIPKQLVAKVKTNCLTVGFVGRWSEEKRPELFLEIARRFVNHKEDFQFIMVGSGMRHHIDNLNKCGVKFLGEINSEEKMTNLYENIDILLITSKSEGFPMVIMEAMAHGVVPISTDVGGISEHLTSKFNGFLVNDTNEDEIADNFSKLIYFLEKDRKEMQIIAENAQKYAKNNFAITKFNKSYKKLFETLIQS